jgi:hypothetical protein
LVSSLHYLEVLNRRRPEGSILAPPTGQNENSFFPLNIQQFIVVNSPAALQTRFDL